MRRSRNPACLSFPATGSTRLFWPTLAHANSQQSSDRIVEPDRTSAFGNRGELQEDPLDVSANFSRIVTDFGRDCPQPFGQRIARFGRAMATHVVDQVEQRIEAPRQRTPPVLRPMVLPRRRRGDPLTRRAERRDPRRPKARRRVPAAARQLTVGERGGARLGESDIRIPTEPEVAALAGDGQPLHPAATDRPARRRGRASRRRRAVPVATPRSVWL